MRTSPAARRKRPGFQADFSGSASCSWRSPCRRPPMPNPHGHLCRLSRGAANRAPPYERTTSSCSTGREPTSTSAATDWTCRTMEARRSPTSSFPLTRCRAGHFLIKFGSGGSSGGPLPAPDLDFSARQNSNLPKSASLRLSRAGQKIDLVGLGTRNLPTLPPDQQLHETAPTSGGSATAGHVRAGRAASTPTTTPATSPRSVRRPPRRPARAPRAFAMHHRCSARSVQECRRGSPAPVHPIGHGHRCRRHADLLRVEPSGRSDVQPLDAPVLVDARLHAGRHLPQRPFRGQRWDCDRLRGSHDLGCQRQPRAVLDTIGAKNALPRAVKSVHDLGQRPRCR